MRKDPVSGLYVTKDGLIFKLKGRWRDGTKHLEPASTGYNHGYLRTCTRPRYQVHHVVWRAFNGEIPPGMQVDHIDNVRSHNAIDNLQLMTPSENCKKSYRQGRRPSPSCFGMTPGWVPWNVGLSTDEFKSHYKNGFHNQFM